MSAETKTVIVDSDSAMALLKCVGLLEGAKVLEERATKHYIAANGVTKDNVGEHVKAVIALKYPGIVPSNKVTRPVLDADGEPVTGADGKPAVEVDTDNPRYAAKRDSNAVRNRLNYWLNKAEAPKSPGTKNLITKDGLAVLADMSHDDRVTALMAELESRLAE